MYDRLPQGMSRVIPVGRLDFMTEGLLLLTNDGELKRELELPRTGVVRTYRARAFGAVTQKQLEELAEGVTIEGITYGSINANLERRTGRNCWIEMSLTEGKNREVRRVLEYLGMQVSRLIRTAYGPFTLEGLDRRNRRGRTRASGAVPEDAAVRIIAGAWRGRPIEALRAGDASHRRPRPRNPVLDARQPAGLVRGSARGGPVRGQRSAGSRSPVARRGPRDLCRDVTLRRCRCHSAQRRQARRNRSRPHPSGSALALPPSEPFDLIFADPPYAAGRHSARRGRRESRLARVRGLDERRDQPGEAVIRGGLTLETVRDVGRARLTLLRRP